MGPVPINNMQIPKQPPPSSPQKWLNWVLVKKDSQCSEIYEKNNFELKFLENLDKFLRN